MVVENLLRLPHLFLLTSRHNCVGLHTSVPCIMSSCLIKNYVFLSYQELSSRLTKNYVFLSYQELPILKDVISRHGSCVLLCGT